MNSFEADINSADIFFMEAKKYFFGVNVPEDKSKAIELFNQAIALDYAPSMHTLAWMYRKGEGLAEDKSRTIELYNQAVALDHAPSINNLAWMYRKGEGQLSKNMTKAIEIFEHAITLGDIESMYSLGRIYDLGITVTADKVKAASLFNQAAKLGHQLSELYCPHKLVENICANMESSSELKSAFLDLEAVIRKIKKRHIYNDNKPLSHFTSWTAIESILPIKDKDKDKDKNVLRLYHVDYMNDPAEGRSLIDLMESDTKTIDFLKLIFDKGVFANNEDLVDSIPPAIYSVSFTESSDRLDLWRAYGNDGDGFSIITAFDNLDENNAFERSSLDAFEIHLNNTDSSSYVEGEEERIHYESKQISPILFKIFYSSKEKKQSILDLKPSLMQLKKIRGGLEQKIKNKIDHTLYALLLEIMYLYKDEQYSTEKEIRAIRAIPLAEVLEDERTPGRLYAETAPILFTNKHSKIVIGPKVPNKQVTLWNLRYRLNKNGFGNKANVDFSKVRYR